MIGDAYRLADVRAFLELITNTAAEVEQEMRDQKESSMEKYWMVHRPGGTGPATVPYERFEDVLREARRLTRKEMDRFVILETVFLVEPYETVLTEENVGAGPAPEGYEPEIVRTTGPVGLDDPDCCAERVGLECDPKPRRPYYCRAPEEENGEVVCLDPECDCAGIMAKELEECSAVESVRSEDIVRTNAPVGLGDTVPDVGCSCWWCDPGNHDVENCEFPGCQCKSFLDELGLKIIETSIADFDQLTEILRKTAVELDDVPGGPIPKADCPCGCTDEQRIPDWSERETENCDCPACRCEARAEYPSPLGEGEAGIRREWMPRPKADLTSSYAGWTIEDFEDALAKNLQARSDLCAGLLERRGQEPEPSPSDWCPHCGFDLDVERPCDCERLDLHPDIKCPHGN